MESIWQHLVAISVAVAAAGYLLFRGLGYFARGTGCGGGCSSCPTTPESKTDVESFVSLEQLRKSAGLIRGRGA